MKIKTLIIGIVIAAAALAAGNYMAAPKEKMTAEVAPQVEKKFYVLSRQGKSTSKSKLQSAKKLSDFVAYYPSSWVTNYDSVAIFTTSNGVQKRAFGKSEKLTLSQSEILRTADMFSEVVVFVKHKTINSITKEVEENEMTIELTVRPEVLAEYPSGIEGFQAYLRKNSENDIMKMELKDGFIAIAYFTINEEGQPQDIEVAESSGYDGVDHIISTLLQNMPKWKPAQDAEGNKVKQKFEFLFGYGVENGC